MSTSNPTTITPQLSLSLANFSASATGTWTTLFDRVRAADEAGIDRIIVVDHVVMGNHLKDYDGGVFPTGPDGAWLEPMTVLAALSSITSRVRLSTGIVLAALRRPAVFAKQAATLDVLSGGRLDLGVGVGWQREEYEAAGLDFAARGRLLDLTIDVCQTLWRNSPASYQSPELSFEEVWCSPRPMQPGGVPIWISGRVHPRTLRRIVRFGDGWIPWGEFRADITRGIGDVRDALESAGRDLSTFQIRGSLPIALDGNGRPDLGQAFDDVPALVEAGVTDFNLGIRLPDDRQATTDLLAEVVSGFRAATQ